MGGLAEISYSDIRDTELGFRILSPVLFWVKIWDTAQLHFERGDSGEQLCIIFLQNNHF